MTMVVFRIQERILSEDMKTIQFSDSLDTALTQFHERLFTWSFSYNASLRRILNIAKRTTAVTEQPTKSRSCRVLARVHAIASFASAAQVVGGVTGNRIIDDGNSDGTLRPAQDISGRCAPRTRKLRRRANGAKVAKTEPPTHRRRRNGPSIWQFLNSTYRPAYRLLYELYCLNRRVLLEAAKTFPEMDCIGLEM